MFKNFNQQKIEMHINLILFQSQYVPIITGLILWTKSYGQFVFESRDEKDNLVMVLF